jgi:hypothetical protein
MNPKEGNQPKVYSGGDRNRSVHRRSALEGHGPIIKKGIHRPVTRMENSRPESSHPPNQVTGAGSESARGVVRLQDLPLFPSPGPGRSGGELVLSPMKFGAFRARGPSLEIGDETLMGSKSLLLLAFTDSQERKSRSTSLYKHIPSEEFHSRSSTLRP